MDRKQVLGKYENLIGLINDLDKDWFPDWNNKDEYKYYIVYRHESKTYFISANTVTQDISKIYMSKDTAKIIYNKLKGI